MSFLTDIATAIGNQLGREIDVGADKIHASKAWPRIVLARKSETVEPLIETGRKLSDTGAGSTQRSIFSRRLSLEWHLWESTEALADTTLEALYVAFKRVARANDWWTSIDGATWPAEENETSTTGGAYIIVTCQIGRNVIDSNASPLLKPTAVDHVGMFTGPGGVPEEVC